MAPTPVIRLHPDDSVVIARTALLPGARGDDGGIRAFYRFVIAMKQSTLSVLLWIASLRSQ